MPEEDLLFWPDLTLAAVKEDVSNIAKQTVTSPSPLRGDTAFNAAIYELSRERATVIALSARLRFDSFSTLARLGKDISKADIDLRLPQSLPSESSSNLYPPESHSISITSSIPRDQLYSMPSSNQVKKDLQRDTLILNGRLIRGATTPYEEILESLTRLTHDRSLAETALAITSRTWSGGIGFEKVHDVNTSAQPSAPSSQKPKLVLPDSSHAPPVELLGIKGRVLVKATTKYRLDLEENVDNESSGEKVDAVVLAVVEGARREGIVVVERAR